MKRYLKVNGRWIDTLIQQKAGFYYYVIEGVVYYMYDEYMTECIEGKLEDESDVI